MNRSELELAIIAIELNGILGKIEKRSTPQLRAMLRESKKNHGAVIMTYAAMRNYISGVAALFAERRINDESVTPEPSKIEPLSLAAQGRAVADFR